MKKISTVHSVTIRSNTRDHIFQYISDNIQQEQWLKLKPNFSKFKPPLYCTLKKINMLVLIWCAWSMLFTSPDTTYLDIDSSKCCSESWKRAATVGVRGFMVTNRPLALLIVLAASWLDRTCWNILLTICYKWKLHSTSSSRLSFCQPVLLSHYINL